MQIPRFLAMSIKASSTNLMFSRFTDDCRAPEEQCDRSNLDNPKGIGSIVALDLSGKSKKYRAFNCKEKSLEQGNSSRTGMAQCLSIHRGEMDRPSTHTICSRWKLMRFDTSSKISLNHTDRPTEPVAKCGERNDPFPADAVRATCARVHFNDWVRIDTFDPDSCPQQYDSNNGCDWSHPMKTVPFPEMLPEREIPSYVCKELNGRGVSARQALEAHEQTMEKSEIAQRPRRRAKVGQSRSIKNTMDTDVENSWTSRFWQEMLGCTN